MKHQLSVQIGDKVYHRASAEVISHSWGLSSSSWGYPFIAGWLMYVDVMEHPTYKWMICWDTPFLIGNHHIFWTSTNKVRFYECFFATQQKHPKKCLGALCVDRCDTHKISTTHLKRTGSSGVPHQGCIRKETGGTTLVTYMDFL